MFAKWSNGPSSEQSGPEARYVPFRALGRFGRVLYGTAVWRMFALVGFSYEGGLARRRPGRYNVILRREHLALKAVPAET